MPRPTPHPTQRPGPRAASLGRLASRLVLVVLLAVPVLVLGGGPAQACSCADPRPRQLLADATAAFAGVVEDRDGEVTGFAVDRVWAGEVSEHVEVAHTLDGGTCGIDPDPGERMAVFAQREQGVLRTGLCSVTDDVALVEQVLGPGASPRSGSTEVDRSGDAAPPLAVAAGLVAGVLAAAAAARVVRRRRR